MIGQFNTHDKTSPDVRKMEQFLNGLSVDRIVIGIVKGDAYKGIQANKNIKKAMVGTFFLVFDCFCAFLNAYNKLSEKLI